MKGKPSPPDVSNKPGVATLLCKIFAGSLDSDGDCHTKLLSIGER